MTVDEAVKIVRREYFREKRREWYAKNRDKERAQQHDYYWQNRGKILERKNERRRLARQSHNRGDSYE